MSEDIHFRSIRVRLTRSGTLYILLTLTLGVVAVNSGNNLLYLAVSGLLSLLALSGVLAYMNLRGLAAGLRLPEEAYAGHPVTIGLEISNRKRRLPSFLILCDGDESAEAVVEILPGGAASIPLSRRFSRRGLQPLGEQVITSVFPFGLVVRGGSFGLGASFLVYPQPRAVRWDFVEKAERQGQDTPLAMAGVGGDYRGIREYLPGDPLSRVHWKGWLRHRRYMTKEFEAEGSPPVFFSYDNVPGPGQEERLSQLTWLVRTALRRGRVVGLHLPGSSFPPGTGAAHRRTLLSALALFGKDRERA